MYRASSDVTSRLENDVTAPSVCAALLLLVYWRGRLQDNVNACKSPLLTLPLETVTPFSLSTSCQ